jgi:hypothetical protein
MMVPTELRESRIHGIGVFLTRSVSKGELIWRFDGRIDRVYSTAELEAAPPAIKDFLKTYSTLHRELGLWVLCGDNGRHFNHSEQPTTLSLGIAFGDDIASADLTAGTELTSDYRTICDAMREGMDFSQPHSTS